MESPGQGDHDENKRLVQVTAARARCLGRRGRSQVHFVMGTLTQVNGTLAQGALDLPGFPHDENLLSLELGKALGD
mgnify:CR=1 FL=1